MRVPKQKGNIHPSSGSRTRLTNDEGNSFLVHVACAYIWEKADGQNTIKDIADMLIAELELPERDHEAEWDNVSLALRSLEQNGLIEYIETKD